MPKKIKCLIIDDEEIAISVIKSHLSLVDDFELVDVFHSGIEAFKAIDNIDCDLIFLDIQMPRISGLSMLKMLKNPPAAILTTAHRDYAIEGFDLNVIDYLLKPIGVERFMQSLDKARMHLSNVEDKQNTSSQKHIFIKADRKYHKVYFEEIQYVEAVKNHVKIVLDRTTLISLISISELRTSLPKDEFLQIHRSYIINKNKIESFSANDVSISNQTIPIGRTYKNQTKEKLKFLLL